MDMQEIISTVRDLTGYKNESNLGTPLIKKYINMGQDKISQLLLTLYHEWLVKSLAATGTGTIWLPGDVMTILDATRAGTPCEKVPVEDKNMIGWSVNHPGSADFPCIVQEGSGVIFYPALASTAYVIRYRKKLCPMIEGSMLSGSTTTVTFPGEAQPVDDVYNDYMLTLYNVTAGMKTFYQTLRITDYVGSTKVATLGGTIVNGPTTYYGALWSLLPSEYHPMIVDGGIWYLARAGLYTKQTPAEIMNSIMASVNAELGITHPLKEQFQKENE